APQNTGLEAPIVRIVVHDAAPPPDLFTGWRGGSSISQASRYATWLAVRMPAFGYPKAHGQSSSRVSMWDRQSGMRVRPALRVPWRPNPAPSLERRTSQSA
ncbi:hypothetical protein, partial [Methylobacterium sp. Leaf89]|uniref:hypothetical protein n=1 Tax=Methylobacterium sp. Leaf89 TaxID=1736245 RepID=UPI001AEC08B5